jgi:hypothetical protein
MRLDRRRYYRKPIVDAVKGDEPHVAVKRVLAAEALEASGIETDGRDMAGIRMGVTGQRMSDLRCGRLSRFTCDSLINMLAHAGFQVAVTVSEAEHRTFGYRRLQPSPPVAPNRGGPGRVGPSRVGPSRVGPIGVGPGRVGRRLVCVCPRGEVALTLDSRRHAHSPRHEAALTLESLEMRTVDSRRALLSRSPPWSPIPTASESKVSTPSSKATSSRGAWGPRRTPVSAANPK